MDLASRIKAQTRNYSAQQIKTTWGSLEIKKDKILQIKAVLYRH